MSSVRRMLGRGTRRWTLLALVACVAWLLVQNSILLAWWSRQYAGTVVVIARALLKVGATLAAEWWMLPLAVFLGVALALSGRARTHDGENARGVSHV